MVVLGLGLLWLIQPGRRRLGHARKKVRYIPATQEGGISLLIDLCVGIEASLIEMMCRNRNRQMSSEPAGRSSWAPDMHAAFYRH